jgi:hypothetical protein
MLFKNPISPIIALFIAALTFIRDKFYPWNYILLGAALLWLILVGIYLIRRRKNTNNWIKAYYSSHKKLPIIPEYLLPVFPKYEKGNPINKDIEIINMSGQFWYNLLPSQRRELQQLVEWLGMNWEDYLEQMKRMLPKDLKLGNTHKPFKQ